MPYDVAAIRLIRASNRFRITLDTNRYSVPSEYACTRLTLKAYPDHLVVYHQDKLIARHVRSYDRHQDFENPDCPLGNYWRNGVKPANSCYSGASSCGRQPPSAITRNSSSGA
jgi:hypothetical protein